MARGVVVFIDYQNVYRGARRAFHHPSEPHWMGQFSPLLIGLRLAELSRFDRYLTQVRVYRGKPDQNRDPKGHAAVERQIAAWARAPEVRVITRPLKYPPGWPHQGAGLRPQEKGIDVALALDFAIMAAQNEFDIGVMFSTDTDLKP